MCNLGKKTGLRKKKKLIDPKKGEEIDDNTCS